MLADGQCGKFLRAGEVGGSRVDEAALVSLDCPGSQLVGGLASRCQADGLETQTDVSAPYG